MLSDMEYLNLDNKIQTGSKILDSMLDGGYEKDTVTTVYGPAGSGKTLLCILCSIGVAMLYRLELGKNEDIHDVNRELGRQIAWLTEIARKKRISVLIADQVYADF